MELNTRDTESFLGPIVNEVGVISQQKRDEIIVQITAHLNRVVNEKWGGELQSILSKMDKLQEIAKLNGSVQSLTKKVVELEAAARTTSSKNGIIEKMLTDLSTGIDEMASNNSVNIDTIDKQQASIKILLDTIRTQQEGEPEKISTDGKSDQTPSSKTTERTAPTSKKPFKPSVVKKTSKSSTKKEETKKVEEPNDDISKNISEGLKNKLFKDLVQDAKKLKIDIKPRMRKEELIEAIVKKTVVGQGE